MNAVAPGFCADIDHGIADAFGLGEENFFLARDAEGQRVDQRILRIARLEADFAADGRHAKTISVVRDAANHAIEDAAILGGSSSLVPLPGRDFAEAQRIEHRNRTRAHRENVAQDSADAGGRSLERLDVTRMIVRFDFERGDKAVADVHDAGIFARTLHHEFAARRQALQMHFARFVRAVLAPHHAENAEFGDVGIAPEDFLDACVFVRVRPCSAAISGVTLISVGAVAITLYSLLRQKIRNNRGAARQGSRRRLRGANERFDHGLENHQSVGGIESRFDGALRMRHQAGNVAFAIANACDVVHRAVGISGGIIRSVRSRVAENDLAIFLEVRERRFVAGVVAVVVRDGNFQDLALLRGVGKRRVGLLDANVNVTADVAQAAVAHHRARQQARFQQNLKSIADAEDHAAAVGKFFDRLHHRGKARNRAGAQDNRRTQIRPAE